MAGSSNGNKAWQGRVISIQPRIRLTRSFDERSHSDVGYGLRLDGTIGERGGEFLVGIGVAAQASIGDIKTIVSHGRPRPGPIPALAQPNPALAQRLRRRATRCYHHFPLTWTSRHSVPPSSSECQTDGKPGNDCRVRPLH